MKSTLCPTLLTSICRPWPKTSCGSTASILTSRPRCSSNSAICARILPRSPPRQRCATCGVCLWSSIDNDTSRDLDQIEVAEQLPNGEVKVLVGIADLDAFVPKQTAIDQHAARETTTVYAGIRNFPMLPEELSTGKTSLLENQDCLSVVIEFVVDDRAATLLPATSIAPWFATGRNSSTTQWERGWKSTAAAPAKVAASADLQAQLRLQDEMAQKLKDRRFENGALNLQTDELHPLVLNEQVVGVEQAAEKPCHRVD